MSIRPMICQIVPTTFHGIRSGSDITTRQKLAQTPGLGIDGATRMPSGTWIASMMAQKTGWRPSASHIRLS